MSGASLRRSHANLDLVIQLRVILRVSLLMKVLEAVEASAYFNLRIQLEPRMACVRVPMLTYMRGLLLTIGACLFIHTSMCVRASDTCSSLCFQRSEHRGYMPAARGWCTPHAHGAALACSAAVAYDFTAMRQHACEEQAAVRRRSSR